MPCDSAKLELLKDKARAIRRWSCIMTAEAGSGHPGGSLSAADLLAVLYFHVMRHDPANPGWPDRDRFILSKGHACPALYAALYEAGYLKGVDLKTLRKLGSPLQGHPDKRKLPVLEASTGSLGQGLSVGIGMALAAKMDGRNYRTYVMLGDGECDEGQVWEAAMWAGAKKLDNLAAIVDYNKIQLDDFVKAIVDLEPLEDKWRAFNWDVQSIDGHDMEKIIEAFDRAAAVRGKPQVIIAHTIKGKGVSFMENKVKFHGVAPTKDELTKALAELDRA